MIELFEPIQIDTLNLPNRFMRSATNEFLGDPITGAPKHELSERYRELADGGVGLIVTGWAYVEKLSQMRSTCVGMHTDSLVDIWRKIIEPARKSGAKLIMQVGHSGGVIFSDDYPDAVSPSGISPFKGLQQPHVATENDIARIIEAFAATAKRVQQAGFDGLQLHACHGCLVTQFLSPHTNVRTDNWGGDAVRRRAFLLAVIEAVIKAVGPDFPVWVKLGIGGSPENGPGIEEGVETASACISAGVDCIEVSHGIGVPERPANTPDREARLWFMADRLRKAVGPTFPFALVDGFKNLDEMARVVSKGTAQLVSLCRPLIAEPNLVEKLRTGIQSHALCERCNRCRPKKPGQALACRNEHVLEKISAQQQV